MSNRTKLILSLLFCFASIWLPLLIAAARSEAHVGFAHGFGLSSPHPLTPHVGRFYYTPGNNTVEDAYKAASSGETELQQFLDDRKKVKHDEKKARCADNYLHYFGRHGVTTPRPLKGFVGCKKYAMDEGYWRARRGEPRTSYNISLDYYVTNTLPTKVAVSVHNVVLPW